MLKLANLLKLYTFVSIKTDLAGMPGGCHGAGSSNENNETGINHNTRMK